MTAPIPGAPEALASIYADAEARLIALIAQRLEAGLDAPDWAVRQLAEVGQLSAAAQGILDDVHPLVQSAINTTVAESAAAGIAAADAEIAGANAFGMAPPLAPAMGVVDAAAVAALAHETVSVVAATHHAILRDTQDAYRSIIAETTGRTITGVQNRRQTLQQSLDRFAQEGLSGFTDRAGRRWHMDTYADMALRTSAFRAQTQGHASRLRERGYDLIVVSNHPRPAPECQPYEGKVLSLSGEVGKGRHTFDGVNGEPVTVTVAATVDEAERRGLHHPNCRHRYTLYVPGARIPEPEPYDPQGYRDEQKLRYLERQVRAAKRAEAAALDDEGRARARARIRDYQARIRDHTASTNTPRRRFREQLREGNAGNAIAPTRATVRRPPPDTDGPSSGGGGGGTPRGPKPPKPKPGPYDEIDDLEELSTAAERAIEAGDFDALDAIDARESVIRESIAKREAKNQLARDKRAAATAAKQAAADAEYDRLIAAGVGSEEAVERAFGVSIDQQRRENAIHDLRSNGYSGAGFDEITRNAYNDVVHTEWLNAENELTFLVRKELAAEIDPRELWKVNESTARKWATPELLEYWDQHGRTTLDGYREGLLGGVQAGARGGDFYT